MPVLKTASEKEIANTRLAVATVAAFVASSHNTNTFNFSREQAA